MAATYEPIAFTTLGSTASEVSFTSIPNTYTDLIVNFVGTNTTASDIIIAFDTDTNYTNYSRAYIYANQSNASVGSNDGAPIYPTILTGVSATYPEFVTFNIQNYASTSKYKNVFGKRAANHGSAGEVDLVVGIWKSTAAVSTVYLRANSNTFKVGSTFALYGIKAA